MGTARQADFDHFVRDLVDNNGSSLEEAVNETLETFSESSYDTSGIFIYKNKMELDEKEKIEKSCRTIEDTADGKNSSVNMTFAIQSLEQSFGRPVTSLNNAMKLIVARGLVNSSLRVLSQTLEKDEEQEAGGGDAATGEDDESDDEDENRLMIQSTVFGFLLFVADCARRGPVSDISAMMLITEENLAIFCKVLDQSMSDARVTSIALDFLETIATINEANKQFLLGASIVDTLDLIGKMHKKKENMQAKVRKITDIFQS